MSGKLTASPKLMSDAGVAGTAADLVKYCGEGRLTLEEFSQRVGVVLAAKTQADGSADHREGDLCDHAEGRGSLLAGRRRHRDVHDGAHMGACLAHGRPAKANLAAAAGQLPGDRREQEPATDGRCGDASHGHPVDGALCHDAVADPADGPVLHEAAQEGGVLLAARITEIELERVAIQGG